MTASVKTAMAWIPKARTALSAAFRCSPGAIGGCTWFPTSAPCMYARFAHRLPRRRMASATGECGWRSILTVRAILPMSDEGGAIDEMAWHNFDAYLESGANACRNQSTR